MSLQELSGNRDETAQHLRAVEQLCAELQAEEAEVLPLYEAALRDLLVGAQVRDYLALFAARRTRELLQGRRAPRYDA